MTDVGPGNSGYSSQNYKTEFFWLCADCSRHFTLARERSNGTEGPVLRALVSSPKQQFRQNDKEKVYEAA